jgi:hypothetical protein
MVAYDVDARVLDDRVPLATAFRAALLDARASVRETRIGDLALDGLGRGHSITFAIRALAPSPIAHDAIPVADLCASALATPTVVPAPVDFGETPYGHTSRRVARISNDGDVPMRALRGTETIAIPARSAVDVSLEWKPEGDALGCETQTRDETLVFLRDVPDGISPSPVHEQSAVIHERVRTGRETITDTDRIDTAGRHEPDFEKATSHDVACPPDFVVTSCKADKRVCSDVAHDCSGDGYAAVASIKGNGCHFACKGPAADPRATCRFDAVTECRLACSHF